MMLCVGGYYALHSIIRLTYNQSGRCKVDINIFEVGGGGIKNITKLLIYRHLGVQLFDKLNINFCRYKIFGRGVGKNFATVSFFMLRPNVVYPHTTTPHKPPHQNSLITSTYTNTTKPTKRPRTPMQTKTINHIKDTSLTKIKNHSDTTPQITPTRHKRITTTRPISYNHGHTTQPTP